MSSQNAPVDADLPVAAPLAPQPPENAEALEQASLSCLLDVLESLSDPRKPKGRRHRQSSIPSLVIIAFLAGKRNPSQIADFARKRPALLKRLGFAPLKRPRRPEHKGVIVAPDRVTIGRVLDGVDTEEFNVLFARWVGRMLLPGGRAAIDGKALRGSDDYVLSVFVHDLRQVVWQEDVGVKDNELGALKRSMGSILERLKTVRLFTGDAAFCQKEVVRGLVEAKRDYLLQLKNNHPTDFATARDAFRQITAQRPAEASTVEKRGVQEGRNS